MSLPKVSQRIHSVLRSLKGCGGGLYQGGHIAPPADAEPNLRLRQALLIMDRFFTVSHWENTYYSAAFHIGNLMLVSLLEIPKASTTLLDMSSHSESSEVCQEVKSG